MNNVGVGIVKVFISSPSDLAAERKICASVVERLNRDPFLIGDVALKAFAWDDPNARVPFLAALSPQEAVNRGMIRPGDADVFVAMFWSRMGTPLPYPEFKKVDGTPFLSGTEWELQDALDSWTAKRKPEILIYRCQRPALPSSQSGTLEAFLKDIGPSGTRPIKGMFNTFTDPEDFRFQFDFHLRVVLRQLIGGSHIQSHSVTIAVPAIERTASMNLLVSRFDNCNVVNGRLEPCKYHGDRLEVEFHEQEPDRDGQREIDDRTIELLPTKGNLDLFERMQQKRAVAGHWGLMWSHREWLVTRLRELFRQRAKAKERQISVLQLGTAGPIHYAGTAKLIASAANEELPRGRVVDLCTYDRCLTPVVTVRALLARLNAVGRAKARKADRLSIEAIGLKRTLDASISEAGIWLPEFRNRLAHRIEVCDICAGEGLLDGPITFDAALAHFTFSMWQRDCDALCEQAFKNLATSLKPAALLFAALGELHNPAIQDAQYFHDRLGRAGFRLIQQSRVWDIYDLSQEDRRSFLRDRMFKRFTKSVVLAAYQLER